MGFQGIHHSCTSVSLCGGHQGTTWNYTHTNTHVHNSFDVLIHWGQDSKRSKPKLNLLFCGWQAKGKKKKKELLKQKHTISDAGTCCGSGGTIKQAAQSPGTLPSMFEQHIITDQDSRAHSEGKIAISPNYKAGHDPYLSFSSNNCWMTLCWGGWQ